jgi:hypothetical protein
MTNDEGAGFAGDVEGRTSNDEVPVASGFVILSSFVIREFVI